MVALVVATRAREPKAAAVTLAAAQAWAAMEKAVWEALPVTADVAVMGASTDHSQRTR